MSGIVTLFETGTTRSSGGGRLSIQARAYLNAMARASTQDCSPHISLQAHSSSWMPTRLFSSSMLAHTVGKLRFESPRRMRCSKRPRLERSNLFGATLPSMQPIKGIVGGPTCFEVHFETVFIMETVHERCHELSTQVAPLHSIDETFVCFPF